MRSWILLVLLCACSADPVQNGQDAATTSTTRPEPVQIGHADDSTGCAVMVFETDGGFSILESCPAPRRPGDVPPDPLGQRGNPAPYR